MRSRIRSLGLVALAVAAVVALGWTSPMATVAQLLAATALIMGGTQHPLSTAESNEFVTGYLANAAGFINSPEGPATVDNTVAVITPEEFFPTYGSLTFNASVAAGQANLDNCIRGAACSYNPVGDAPPTGVGNSLVVYGYSQSAVVASLEKQALIDYYLAHPDETPPDVSFVLIANPMRPNGGILERFNGLTIPILDVTFYGATPTNSADIGSGVSFTTVDVTQQYDGWSDFPVYPLNLVADANAIMGILYLHGNYTSGQMADAVYQGSTGDTSYYMIPTGTLPLLIPLVQLGVPSPIIKVLDAPLRVLVEMGYDRETDPGVPTTARLIRLVNPVADVINLAVAIPTGLDDGIEEVTGTRPFHTEPTDMYGVHVGDALLSNLTTGVPLQGTANDQGALLAGSSAESTPGDPPPADPPGDDTVDGQPGGSATLKNVDHGPDLGPNKPTTQDLNNVVTLPSPGKKPFEDLIRNPIGAPPDKPKVIRPTGDGPLQKAVKALTGQRPDATTSGDGGSNAKPDKKFGPRHLKKDQSEGAA